MKNYIFPTLRIILIIVFTLIVISRFSDFGKEIERFLYGILFSVIGILYLIFGWAFSETKMKLSLILGGLFLIIMNFIPQNITIKIVVIICIVTPLILCRFSKEAKEAKDYKNAIH